MRRKLRSSPSDALFAKFRELGIRVKKMVRESRDIFYNSLDANFQTNDFGRFLS